jgi:Mor family transcriptional regulator
MLMARGEEEPAAMEFGFEVAEFLRRHWGGEALYIPRGQEWFLSQRDQEILQEFNGNNRTELCHKFGISSMRLYQIIQAGSPKRSGE